MKTSEKILFISIGLILIASISAIFSWVLVALFGVSFWPIFIGLALLQIVGQHIADRYLEINVIKKGLQEYNAKPYKEFIIPLTCQVCGKVDNVTMDLSETEYRCTSCQRKNAIYVTFATAAMSIDSTTAS